MHSTIRLIIADEHKILCEGFKASLSIEPAIEVVAFAACGQQLLQLAEIHRPDVVLTETGLPILNGIEAAKLIKEKHPATGIVAFDMLAGQHTIAQALAAGIGAFLSKKNDIAYFIAAIKAVYQGGIYYPQGNCKSFYTLTMNKEALFTKKELEIISLICKENFSWQIAKEVNLGVRTVEVYREKIMAKMGVKTLVGLVLYAVKHHLHKLVFCPFFYPFIQWQMLPEGSIL